MRRELLIALVALTGCSVVQHSHVRPDYDAEDKQKTVRLIALAVPSPNGDAARGRLVAKITQRYANHHRDFVVTTASTAASLPEDRCADDMHGVLKVAAKYTDGDEIGIEAEAEMVRCRDGEQVWAAGGSGSWPKDDPQISQVIKQYREEIGEDVAPYVPATFHLLRALLDTLPYPELVDDDLVLEKIDLED
ncbi:MAG: MXAN_6521/LA_1396 family lipoprotein [Deltaproteobacteria bacterium]|jgi:probable lipoprotein (TIGR04455 family)